MKKKKWVDELWKIMVWFVVFIVIVAISIMFSFKYSIYGSELKISDYFNFIGSFGGAALSSVISFIILFITIFYNKSEQEENMLNSARPVLKIKFNNNEIRDNPKIYYIKVDPKEHTFDNLNLSIKNIGTGPARSLKIKIKDEYVKTYGNLIEKNDIGVNEEIIINIRTKYNDLLINDSCNIFIECIDIYNKRQYVFQVKAIKLKEYTSVEYYELIDEKVIEL